MRGGAVGILCILKEVETGDEYALITQQPRIPAGYSDFAEIPAGMVWNLYFYFYLFLSVLTKNELHKAVSAGREMKEEEKRTRDVENIEIC